MPRFTILLHSTEGTPNWRQPASQGSLVAFGPSHWDWLFETEDPSDTEHSLLTWATDPLDNETLTRESLETPAVQLPNHKRLYLNFEGELTGDRGSVRQVTTGEFKLVTQSQQLFEVELACERIGAVDVAPGLKAQFCRMMQGWRLQITAG